ncbi:MAG: tetratricopeptide repeat-containing protein [Microcystis aeruginosa W13-18]|nr:tetratricopeptide repeat protein [Microcystis sp. LSC13-02]NCQ87158.1 tetratricopeptide repeat-containing protein [Microcystis aeruginosa W13-18]NCR38104.1 tetratricopeptide repeat-containing protein [Microcystis aeruginosa S11-05]NCR51617.1 tetratricopeptide repeat-containing protein [Microcystis aeruginosa S11-01]NCR58273.1 tetratricopeptide repeat-containing protein [Microcystis aeruginosa LL13-06]NCS50499.1 tetratricopeptide repeat-containing protein [Microcystis aeruginosa BK11-02]NCS
MNQPRVMGEALNNLGNICADLGEYRQAIAFYEQGLRLGLIIPSG